MMTRRPYLVRRATSNGGKEVTLPREATFQPGDQVIVLSDGFVVVVPRDAEVDEAALKAAIKSDIIEKEPVVH